MGNRYSGLQNPQYFLHNDRCNQVVHAIRLVGGYQESPDHWPDWLQAYTNEVYRVDGCSRLPCVRPDGSRDVIDYIDGKWCIQMEHGTYPVYDYFIFEGENGLVLMPSSSFLAQFTPVQVIVEEEWGRIQKEKEHEQIMQLNL